MATEDLQKLSSLLRWIGFVVTCGGVIITFSSHVIADRLLVSQRNDKKKSEARLTSQLQTSEDELLKTKTKVHDLETKVKPRNLTEDQKKLLEIATKNAPRGKFRIMVPVSSGDDALPFAVQLGEFFKGLGFEVEGPNQTMAGPVNGLLVLTQKETGSAAAFIQQGLENIGLTCRGELKPDFADTLTVLVIGTREYKK